ncbi:MAG: hypothetical protein FWH40_08730 [Coriobacteriia bacterium]|nr:hypothetical protein [Coriobacteriia bacterium]
MINNPGINSGSKSYHFNESTRAVESNCYVFIVFLRPDTPANSIVPGIADIVVGQIGVAFCDSWCNLYIIQTQAPFVFN